MRWWDCLECGWSLFLSYGRRQPRKVFRIPIDSVVAKYYTTYMGIRLRALREKKGMSLRALADKAGVTFASINRIELGKANPRFETLEKLAKALGVSTRDLIEK